MGQEEIEMMDEWFNRPIDVACSADFCGHVARGTADELNRRFWQIGKYSTFCPTHAAKRIMRRAA